MSFIPLNRSVIIERQEPNKTTDSGIILRSSLEPDKAIVKYIAVGLDEVSVGDSLLINWNKAFKVENELYRISIDDVVAIYEE